MNHPLDGARLKVVRAQEHLDSLKAEIAMYVSQDPYQFVAKKVHPEHSFLAPAAEITAEPPLRFGTLIGDVVTNARAAIDYVMWELASEFFDPPIDLAKANDRRITAFPISEGPADPGHVGHVDRLNRLAKRKIPTTAINEIKAVQPYNSGDLALWWLHRLVNTDKHRVPLLTKAYAGSHASIYPVGEDTAEIIHPDGTRQRNAYVEINGVQVKMQHTLSLQVTLKDVLMPRGPIDRTLEQIIETVANVVPRFNRFFS